MKSIMPILTAALCCAAGGFALAQDEGQEQEEAVQEEAPIVEFADPERYAYRDGEALYRAVCQGCHQAEGEGAVGAGAYPALAENPNLEAAGYPIYVIVHGQRAMPAFGDSLDDEQVAAIVNFIRTNFGNDFQDEASAEDVAAVR